MLYMMAHTTNNCAATPNRAKSSVIVNPRR